MANNHLTGGFSPTRLKDGGVRTCWDDDIPNWMESHEINVPNHQTVLMVFTLW